MILGALVARILLASAAIRSMISGGKLLSEQDFSVMATGQSVVFAFEMTGQTPDGKLLGRFLEQMPDGSYKRTAHEVTVQRDANTAIVMGQSADVYEGAVLQISGTLTATNSVQAQQLVVLTGYVTVQ